MVDNDPRGPGDGIYTPGAVFIRPLVSFYLHKCTKMAENLALRSSKAADKSLLAIQDHSGASSMVDNDPRGPGDGIYTPGAVFIRPLVSFNSQNSTKMAENRPLKSSMAADRSLLAVPGPQLRIIDGRQLSQGSRGRCLYTGSGLYSTSGVV